MRTTAELAAADRRHLWHPFTQQQAWCEEDAPLVIDHAEGTNLYDTDGNAYIDGVSSLWCNVHGHRHPAIDAAVRSQLGRVAHSTMLGLSHEPAIELAERLVAIAPPGLDRVFYSDSGSTAVEVALKMAYQWWVQRGERGRTGFICLENAYHGDTLGAVSVGGIETFHSLYRPLLFDTWQAPAGDADAARAAAGRARRVGRGGDARAARPGRRRDADAASGFPTPRTRALRRARGAADLRRGRDRVRSHRADVRVRARGRLARSPLRRQGDHRRLPAARGDARDRADLRRLPRATPSSSGRSSTATRTPATRSHARLGSRRSSCSRASRRSSSCSRRSSCSPGRSRTGCRCCRPSPRFDSGGSWSGSS